MLKHHKAFNIVALAAFTVGLGGCSLERASVLNPGGPIALAERNMLFFAGEIMLIVLVPVYIMTAVFAFRYRRSTAGARVAYTPDWSFSAVLEMLVWGVPIAIICVLGWQVWTRTHSLDPYKPLAGSQPPVHIQAIALNWKWAFVYPDEGIATVNEIAFPVGAPVTFRITADTTMSAFMVQGLAGQIFAMAGMESRLNLRADRAGDYVGRNMQFSGSGFSGQHFIVKALPPDEYKQWVAKVRSSPKRLDAENYAAVARPSKSETPKPVPPLYFSGADAGLFETIMTKYAPYPGAISSMAHKGGGSVGSPAPTHQH